MIFHVATQQDWSTQTNLDSYAPAAFSREGFIHACHSDQLTGVIQRYFAGRNDLVLLHIDETKLTSLLKHEGGTGGELFPHIYGRINKRAVCRAENFSPSSC